MSNVLDRPATPAPQPDALMEAAEGVIDTLCFHMKPKARAKAKASLETFVARLERDPNTGLPLNVRRLHDGASYAAALAAQERRDLAAAMRLLIGECF